MSAYDANNSKHIAIARRRAKAISDQKATFLKHAMGMAVGRTFFHSLLDGCNVFNPTLFTDNDPHKTSYNCGRHNVGQNVLEDIMHVAPDEYIQMMREAYGRELADDTSRTRSDSDSDRDDSGPVPEYRHPSDDPEFSGDGAARHDDYLAEDGEAE